jgi:hypothetical protein
MPNKYFRSDAENRLCFEANLDCFYTKNNLPDSLISRFLPRALKMLVELKEFSPTRWSKVCITSANAYLTICFITALK